MSITVSDCLKLPSLQEANVIAGHGGLDKFVSAVSVLEYARVFAMAPRCWKRSLRSGKRPPALCRCC